MVPACSGGLMGGRGVCHLFVLWQSQHSGAGLGWVIGDSTKWGLRGGSVSKHDPMWESCVGSTDPLTEGSFLVLVSRFLAPSSSTGSFAAARTGIRSTQSLITFSEVSHVAVRRLLFDAATLIFSFDLTALILDIEGTDPTIIGQMDGACFSSLTVLVFFSFHIPNLVQSHFWQSSLISSKHLSKEAYQYKINVQSLQSFVFCQRLSFSPAAVRKAPNN